MGHPLDPASIASRKKRFLEELSRRLAVKDAAHAIGIDPSTVYEWRGVDPDFKAAMDRAREVGRVQYTDELMDVAMDLARCGNVEMLKYMLKGLRPDMFHERLQIAATQHQRIVIEVDDSALPGIAPPATQGTQAALPAHEADADTIDGVATPAAPALPRPGLPTRNAMPVEAMPGNIPPSITDWSAALSRRKW